LLTITAVIPKTSTSWCRSSEEARAIRIVDLPGPDAACEFVEREPYNRAGLFDEHIIRRFKNSVRRL
jgi:hypothetical protein